MPSSDAAPASPTFAELHAAHRAELLGYLTRRLGAEEAEDVLQEVLLKAARALAGFRGESSVRTWVFRLARNAAIDRRRQRGARPQLESGEALERSPEGEAPLAVAADGEGHDQRLIREEMRACIRERIQTLPEPYREVLRLSEEAGWSDAEIASAVGASAASVRVRLHRARARLREDLAGHCALYRDERNELACERAAAKGAP